jgi:RHS repeat-associated protein
VRQLADETGDLLLTQTFDPYGNPYESASTAAGETHFGFTGEMVDANGLVFLRARYYNPAQGRFFQRDTWGGDNNRPQSLNPYMYALGNPILLTDPSGHRPPVPFWGEAYPTQPGGCITCVPMWWEEDFVERRLEFEPAVGLDPIPGLSHQYDILEKFGAGGNVNCDYKSCGPLSIATILYNLIGDSVDPALILEGFGCKENNLTAPVTLEEYINDNYGDQANATRYWPRDEPEEGGGGTGNRISLDNYFSWIREKLTPPTEWPIVLVGMSVVGRSMTLDQYIDTPPEDANGHFVVITGLSVKDYWGRDPLWQWVRIYNPFNNRIEYYTAADFFRFTTEGYNTTVFVKPK